MNKQIALPEYKSPPVIEVVCGVLFKPLEGLLAPHLGVLWERFRADYPVLQEQPPLAPVFERFDDSPPIQIEIKDRPPLPRTWFVHQEENGIIQVQRDRFLHNWKKVRPSDEYPRYRSVIKMFRERLASFASFLDEVGLGKIEPQQFEMTYVNHIPRGDALQSLNEVAKVFPDFGWRDNESRFLSHPEAYHWRTSFALPDNTGRLHTTIRSAVRREDGEPILLFELTARGIGQDASEDSMWTWFDVAHEWIVRGFTDLTGNVMHKDVWKRTK